MNKIKVALVFVLHISMSELTFVADFYRMSKPMALFNAPKLWLTAGVGEFD